MNKNNYNKMSRKMDSPMKEKKNMKKIKGKQSIDLSGGISVFAGKDVYSKYEKDLLTQSNVSRNSISKDQTWHASIYHGKQLLSFNKADQLIAKRESRALRKAKIKQ